MSTRALDRMIQGAAAGILENPHLRQKDILAWVSCRHDDVPEGYEPEEGEIGIYLESLGLFCVFPADCDKR